MSAADRNTNSPYVSATVTQRSIEDEEVATLRSLLSRFLHDHDSDPDLSTHSADLIKAAREATRR